MKGHFNTKADEAGALDGSKLVRWRPMIRNFLARLFARLLARLRKQDPQARNTRWPTREQILLLPPFDALGFDDIVEVANAADAHRARQELMTAGVVGFDTESKPTFQKGHVSTGPHVAQFSTMDKAYVFMLHDAESRKATCDLIASKTLKKVGFGLGDDLKRIPIKLGVQPHSVLDLETLYREKGHGRGVGVKVAVAISLKRRFMKSKKASTSNWASHRLTDKQLLYAANDAYAAICVFHAMASR